MAIKVQYNPSTGKVSYNPTTGKVQAVPTPVFTSCGEVESYEVTFSDVVIHDGCCVRTPDPYDFILTDDIPDINSVTYILPFLSFTGSRCNYRLAVSLDPEPTMALDRFNCVPPHELFNTYTGIQLNLTVGAPSAFLTVELTGGSSVPRPDMFTANWPSDGITGEVTDVANLEILSCSDSAVANDGTATVKVASP